MITWTQANYAQYHAEVFDSDGNFLIDKWENWDGPKAGTWTRDSVWAVHEFGMCRFVLRLHLESAIPKPSVNAFLQSIGLRMPIYRVTFRCCAVGSFAGLGGNPYFQIVYPFALSVPGRFLISHLVVVEKVMSPCSWERLAVWLLFSQRHDGLPYFVFLGYDDSFVDKVSWRIDFAAWRFPKWCSLAASFSFGPQGQVWLVGLLSECFFSPGIGHMWSRWLEHQRVSLSMFDGWRSNQMCCFLLLTLLFQSRGCWTKSKLALSWRMRFSEWSGQCHLRKATSQMLLVQRCALPSSF